MLFACETKRNQLHNGALGCRFKICTGFTITLTTPGVCVCVLAVVFCFALFVLMSSGASRVHAQAHLFHRVAPVPAKLLKLNE